MLLIAIPFLLCEEEQLVEVIATAFTPPPSLSTDNICRFSLRSHSGKTRLTKPTNSRRSPSFALQQRSPPFHPSATTVRTKADTTK